MKIKKDREGEEGEEYVYEAYGEIMSLCILR